MLELTIAVLEWIIGDVILLLIYLVVWAILIPCALIVATPIVLALAMIRRGGFRKNIKSSYGAILRHFGGIVQWKRTRRSSERSSPTS